ncbi:MAG: hypothetical protein HOG18_01550 [Proteobacteria bacterium]|nr:hypothetical protein [Pseudomonadota bacterium]MBT4108086.1 hypothetical protein [Pseudomonadota bacterium]MBT4356180.1 hypothetical protein [Pseudomonadota bacterium]MBT4987699.1 hypothetical protein [Pseudomonadota bacterium]MBT5188706.1 hypothetical protein [Pseudomonadota bacterium]
MLARREEMDAILSWFKAHPGLTGAILVGSLVLAAVYAVLIYVAIARMSPDYFTRSDTTPGGWRSRHPLLRVVALVTKNLVGVLLVVMGILMLVLPGQGILTLLIGISLLDFPGKRELEKRIVGLSAVHTAINKIRSRAGQPPMVLP